MVLKAVKDKSYKPKRKRAVRKKKDVTDNGKTAEGRPETPKQESKAEGRTETPVKKSKADTDAAASSEDTISTEKKNDAIEGASEKKR